jgi:proline iminopeptidase
MQELRVAANDVTLYTRIAGDPGAGNVLIAIHGGPGLPSDTMLSLEQLASGEFTVVTYDQRGSGRSTKPSQDASSYVLLKYVEDLEAVRQATGAERIHLLGRSWGGLVAMRYATIHPKRVSSIVLIGSAPPTRQASKAGSSSLWRRIRALQQEGVISRDLPTRGTALGQAILPAYFSNPSFELPDEMKNLPIDETANRLTNSALGNYDFTSELATLEHRVLILWGEDDPFGLPMGEATRDALSAAQVEFVVLEKCGHFWQECPDEFFTCLRAFFELPPAP